MTTTTRFGIAKPAVGDLVSNGAAAMGTIADGFDAAMFGYSQGAFASRPAAGAAGRVYRATDVLSGGANGTLYFDNGTTWDEMLLGSTRGKSIIATAETRTNAAYGLMPTPDRVQNVVLPTDGKIYIAYTAHWTQAGGASAAIFIGANQLKGMVASAVPAVQEVAHAGGVTSLTPLHTSGKGLVTIPAVGAGSDIGADVTTGMMVGTLGSGDGGEVIVHAAAGTYDISVQFKTGSTVTVSSRKLWVKTES